MQCALQVICRGRCAGKRRHRPIRIYCLRIGSGSTPKLYFVSSTTKVLTTSQQVRQEVDREEFRYVVPDSRLNKSFEQLKS